MVITQREKGQYFTPDNVVRAIITSISVYLKEKESNSTLRVLDPSVGEGIFCNLLIQLLSKKFSFISIDALDIDSEALSKAQSLVNRTLDDKNHTSTFHQKNFLTEFDIENKEEKYDLIISNPPHNAKYPPWEWDNILKTVSYEIPQKIPKESALYFFIKSLDLLKDGGILSFILPKPFIYSNKWKVFREICTKRVRLLEVYDIGNQFSGQLQEQVVISIQNLTPTNDFKTGIWDKIKEEFSSRSSVKSENAIRFDNFLVGITPIEQNLMEKLIKNNQVIEWEAFRGLNSKYRNKTSSIPLVEKATVTHGFLLPERNYVDKDVPNRQLERLARPKIIAQRILTYTTTPKFRFNVPILVDSIGNLITHETIINIFPPNSTIQDLYSYGAILQSKFTVWWLKHAIYTKQFVTSKDFDRPYLNKVLIPSIDGSVNHTFRNGLNSLLHEGNLHSIISLANKESKVDQFFALGRIFKYYLMKGEEIRLLLDQILQLSSQRTNISQHNLMKRIDRDFRTRDDVSYIWLNTKYGLTFSDSIVSELKTKYLDLANIRNEIDILVIMLYGLTEEEERIIVEGDQ